MPQGKGTYGSKVGRPPKKKKAAATKTKRVTSPGGPYVPPSRGTMATGRRQQRLNRSNTRRTRG
jgi:hypothetical protein